MRSSLLVMSFMRSTGFWRESGEMPRCKRKSRESVRQALLSDGRFLHRAAWQGDVVGGGYAGNHNECSEIDGGCDATYPLSKFVVVRS